MKFIRKNGRVIPIQQKGDEKLAHRDSRGGYKKTAAIGAAGGAAAVGGATIAMAMRMPRASKAFSIGGTALAMTANAVRPIVKSAKVQNEVAVQTKDPRKARIAGNKEFMKHWGAGQIGVVAGSVGSAAAIKPVFHAAVSAAKKIKPHTAAYAQARKFRNAKPVQSSTIQTGIARRYK